MKRLGTPDSLGALMSICPTTTEEHNQGHNHVYTREFQTMLEGLDEEGCGEDCGGHVPEKKRRLSVEQVKALEKYFEIENKLEPERKLKLAQELGLQPRQVAVWFQNRRARWKTKQLERDYGVLKASYDALKHNFDALKQDNASLLKEIRELKAKIHEDNNEDKVVLNENTMVCESEQQTDGLANTASAKFDVETTELDFESFDGSNGVKGVCVFSDLKDGSSDSDTSAILNEDNNDNNLNNSPNAAVSSSGGHTLQNQNPTHFLISNGSSSSSSSSSMNGRFQFLDLSKSILEDAEKAAYEPQFVKIEEHNFFSGEDSCTTFFSNDQAPSLHWYNPDEWN